MKMLLDDDRMSLKDFVGSKFYCDGGWELFHGELVAMSPARVGHGAVSARLAQLFGNAIGNGPCKVLSGEVGLKIDDIESFVIPDLSVYCDGSRTDGVWFFRSPEIIVEILSKGTRFYDLNEKRDLYKDAGASEYWVIDIEERWVLVENFETGTKRKFEWGDVAESDFHAGFRFRVEDILRDV
jgi:Uma2 family endonuclease